MRELGDPPTALLARLRRLDTCAISDALDRIGLPGAIIGIRPLWACPRIAGRVVTVKQVSGASPTTHPNSAAVDTARAGDVIVIAAERQDCGAWGGILSVAGRAKGLGGVIIDGASRDADESRDVGFPVFARAAVPVAGRGRLMEQSFNEPIRIGDVDVRPGDLVVADSSGTVFVSAERAEEVIRVAEEIAAREAAMTEAVRSGQPTVDVYRAALGPKT